MTTQTSRKRVSIRTRMVIIFGAVIIVGFTVLTALVMRQTRASVMETVQNQLIDKARDTASIMVVRVPGRFCVTADIARPKC